MTNFMELEEENAQILSEFVEYRITKLKKKGVERLLSKHETTAIEKAIVWEGFDNGVLSWSLNQSINFINPNKNWIKEYHKDTLYKSFCSFNGLPLKYNADIYCQLGLHKL